MLLSLLRMRLGPQHLSWPTSPGMLLRLPRLLVETLERTGETAAPRAGRAHGLRASSWPKRVDMLLGLPRLELADAPGQAAEPAAL